jgi:hypothetical protein
MLEAAFPPIRPGVVLDGFEAFIARLRGGAGRFLFPAYSCRYSPPAIGQPERVTMIPLTTDNTFITCDSTVITADMTEIQMESVFTVSSCPDTVTIIGTLWFNSRRHPVGLNSWISWDDATDWRHLHKIVDLEHDVTTGAATLTVEPPMRALPTPSTPMHVHAPSGVFQLNDDAQGHSRRSGRQTSFSISAQQSFPVAVTA